MIPLGLGLVTVIVIVIEHRPPYLGPLLRQAVKAVCQRLDSDTDSDTDADSSGCERGWAPACRDSGQEAFLFPSPATEERERARERVRAGRPQSPEARRLVVWGPHGVPEKTRLR